MAILKVRKVWRREPRPHTSKHPSRLTAEQQRNVLAALVRLYVAHGEWQRVARDMDIKKSTLSRVVVGGHMPGAGMALRVARAAQVPVEEVLSGEFGRPEVCPMCGGSRKNERESVRPQRRPAYGQWRPWGVPARRS